MLWHDPTDPLVAQLHLQAGSVQNIHLMAPVVLEPESPSYARWRDLLLLTLRRYTLDEFRYLTTVVFVSAYFLIVAQKLLQTVKRPAFQTAFMRIALVKIVQISMNT